MKTKDEARIRLDEAYKFRAHFHAQGPFDMPFAQLREIVGWMDDRVGELEAIIDKPVDSEWPYGEHTC